jgi:hypothetical protein
MHLGVMDYVLWYTSPVLQAVILLCMYRRGLHRDYPFFFNYTILSILSDPILLVLQKTSYSAYYYAYLVNVGLGLLLSFAVLQEIFQNAFRPYEALRDLGIILFRWSALVVLLVAVMWALNLAQKPDKNLLLSVFLLADRSLRLAQCGLVFFLLLLSEYLGIPHRSFLFGLSVGFGFFAAVNMLVLTGSEHRTMIPKTTLRQLNSAAYLVAVMIWLGYTLASRVKSPVLEAGLVRHQDWNSALQDARMPITESSLLDTMDRTVERLLHPSPTESEVPVSAEPHQPVSS